MTKCFRVDFFLNGVEVDALRDSPSTQTMKSYAAEQFQDHKRPHTQGAVPETRVQASNWLDRSPSLVVSFGFGPWQSRRGGSSSKQKLLAGSGPSFPSDPSWEACLLWDRLTAVLRWWQLCSNSRLPLFFLSFFFFFLNCLLCNGYQVRQTETSTLGRY